MRAAHIVTLAACLSFSCSADPLPNKDSTGGGVAGSCEPSGLAYPQVGRCTEIGDVVANIKFEGRRAGISSPREVITPSDWYDPAGTTKNKYLVINVAAFWCSPCKEEAGEIQNKLKRDYGPKGVAFLSVILQDSMRKPASHENVDLWISNYRLDFAVVRDEAQAVARFFDPGLMPLNMIVDLRTMKIVRKIVGADLPRLKSDLDKLLAG